MYYLIYWFLKAKRFSSNNKDLPPTSDLPNWEKKIIESVQIVKKKSESLGNQFQSLNWLLKLGQNTEKNYLLSIIRKLSKKSFKGKKKTEILLEISKNRKKNIREFRPQLKQLDFKYFQSPRASSYKLKSTMKTPFSLSYLFFFFQLFGKKIKFHFFNKFSQIIELVSNKVFFHVFIS